MDRMMVSGIPQPNMLTCEALHTPWPSSGEDFAFGTVRASILPARSGDKLLRDMTGDMSHCYDAVVRGFDIWARILNWIITGGRRLPDMSTPDNSPRVSESPWNVFYEEIQAWQNLQDRRLWFPGTSVASHTALGQAEQFIFVNLVYHVR